MTSRTLASVALAASLLASPALSGQSTPAPTASVEEKLAVLAKAIAEAATPAERARLVRDYAALEAPADAPPASDLDPLMRATALYLRPFQERSARYTSAAGAFLSGQALKATNLGSAAGIADLKRQVNALATENAAIAREVEELIPNVQQAIGGVRATPMARRSFLDGLNQSLFRQRDNMQTLRRTEATLWTQLLELYDFLDRTRGEWSFDSTGQIRFTDPNNGTRFAALVQSLPLFSGGPAAPATPELPKPRTVPSPPPASGAGAAPTVKPGAKPSPVPTPTPAPPPPPDS